MSIAPPARAGCSRKYNFAGADAALADSYCLRRETRFAYTLKEIIVLSSPQPHWPATGRSHHQSGATGSLSLRPSIVVRASHEGLRGSPVVRRDPLGVAPRKTNNRPPLPLAGEWHCDSNGRDLQPATATCWPLGPASVTGFRSLARRLRDATITECFVCLLVGEFGSRRLMRPSLERALARERRARWRQRPQLERWARSAALCERRPTTCGTRCAACALVHSTVRNSNRTATTIAKSLTRRTVNAPDARQLNYGHCGRAGPLQWAASAGQPEPRQPTLACGQPASLSLAGRRMIDQLGAGSRPSSAIMATGFECAGALYRAATRWASP